MSLGCLLSPRWKVSGAIRGFNEAEACEPRMHGLTLAEARDVLRFNEAEACEPRMQQIISSVMTPRRLASMRPRHVSLGCLLRYKPLNIQATLPRFRPPLIRDKQSVPNSPHNPINDIK